MAGNLSGEIKAEPNMTPLLDVVFQLITFFMMVFKISGENYDQRVRLPVAGSARPVEGQPADDRLILNIDGQGRMLGGAVLGTKIWVDDVLQPFIRNTGTSMSAFNAWVMLKGLETLALRIEAGCRAAEHVADFLAGQQGIARVWYPTRADHPQQKLAMQQMTAGGTLVTFEVEGGKDAAFKLMNAFGLIKVSNNLGDSKSLATHPATTTHMRIGAEERAKLGMTDGVIRLSVGLEDVADITDDLLQAIQIMRG